MIASARRSLRLASLFLVGLAVSFAILTPASASVSQLPLRSAASAAPRQLLTLPTQHRATCSFSAPQSSLGRNLQGRVYVEDIPPQSEGGSAVAQFLLAVAQDAPVRREAPLIRRQPTSVSNRQRAP